MNFAGGRMWSWEKIFQTFNDAIILPMMNWRTKNFIFFRHLIVAECQSAATFGRRINPSCHKHFFNPCNVQWIIGISSKSYENIISVVMIKFVIFPSPSVLCVTRYILMKYSNSQFAPSEVSWITHANFPHRLKFNFTQPQNRHKQCVSSVLSHSLIQ